MGFDEIIEKNRKAFEIEMQCRCITQRGNCPVHDKKEKKSNDR